MSEEIVFVCKDKDDVVIVCMTEAWRHIANKHRELKELKELVRAVIEIPDGICQSRNFKNRKTLYKECVLPKPIGKAVIRVVVQYNRKRVLWKEGRVITALVCNGMQQGEVLLWGKRI